MQEITSLSFHSRWTRQHSAHHLMDLARGSSAPPGIFQGTAEGKVTAFPLLLLTRHTLCVLSSVAPVAISWQGRAATRTAGLARPAEAVAQHSEDTTRSTALTPSSVLSCPWQTVAQCHPQQEVCVEIIRFNSRPGKCHSGICLIPL